jgi:mycothiol synthase
VTLERVDMANRGDFLRYCRLHRYDHDESWLSDHDLDSFDPSGPEDVAIICRDGDGMTRGAAALMRRPELQAAGKVRFRILHVEEGIGEPFLTDSYSGFVSGLAPEAGPVDWLYLFLPETARRPSEIVASLGFTIERYAWLLERDLSRLVDTVLPPGFTLREARIRTPSGTPGPDAASWCSVVNAAFARVAGHTELLPARLLSESDPGLDFKGSWLLLEESTTSRVIGVCATVRDIEEPMKAAFLGPVAVVPAFQGRGFGRALLRAGLAAAKFAGCRHCLLSVNAENSGAAGLYLVEGFTKKSVMVCWHRHPLPSDNPLP